MLSISGLSKSFDGFLALRDLDLEVAEGERHAVIGPNGAGKTTLFNLVTGHLKPTKGSIRFLAQPIAGTAPYVIVRRGIARSFQRINIFPRLTVLENVQTSLLVHHGRQFSVFALGGGLYRRETDDILASVGLEDEARTLAGLLAYGKQKQLELALALASDPVLLLLDEPTAGMSPRETTEIISLIGRIAKERRLTLLFTEHDMTVVFTIADRITVLHLGECIASGTPETVRADPEVRRVYLGGGGDAAS